MTIRKILLLPLIISVLLFAYFSPIIWQTLLTVVSEVTITPQFVLLSVLAIVVLFIGHYIRSKKAVLLMEPIELSKTQTQFRAFSVGQLFNNLLPLRIGELIRAGILAAKLNTSFGYSLTLIIIERVLDLFFVIIGVGIILIVFGISSVPLTTALIFLLSVALVGVVFIYLIARQPLWFLKIIHAASGLLNDTLRDQLRFKVWSTGYGLRKSLKPATFKKYLAYTIVMWLIYFAAMLIVSFAVFGGGLSAGERGVTTVAPYFGVSVPSGPAGLGSFSGLITMLTSSLEVTEVSILSYSIIVWFIMVVPISLIGISLLFTKTLEPIWAKRPRTTSDASMENKLSRTEDISTELSAFLDNYFKGNGLSRIVDRLEQRGDFNLVKYFKGGSDAITILALQSGKRVVKKIIPIQFKDRLKAQYDWLRHYGRHSTIVSASNERTEDDHYSIDISFDESSVPLFEYVHEISLPEAQALLDQTWDTLFANVYGTLTSSRKHTTEIDEYIDRHIHQCVDKAIGVDPEITDALIPKKLVINGKTYDNLHQILAKIKKHPQAWADLQSYRESQAVHGDVIIDNLLYSKKKKQVIIIDPAPDGNIVNGPVFDFGKAIQSLYCGYEFLLRDESAVTLDGATISFKETHSTRYSELSAYVRDTLAKKYLNPRERRAMLFHGGVLYLRRLKHQVYYTPENALKFYAVGVRTLNEFLAQYR